MAPGDGAGDSICQKGGIVNEWRVSYCFPFALGIILGYNRAGGAEKAMSGPRFTILASIDDLHFVAACPHGVAHLTWENATLRFTLDEFRALACLVERTITARAQVVLTDGNLSVAWQPLDRCELRVGPVALRLPPADFRKLAATLQEAKRRLDELTASGAWDEPDRQESPPDPFQSPKRMPFSRN
jgi:hypothetical protein